MIIPFFIPHSGCPHQCVFCNQKRITGHNSSHDISLIEKKIRDYLETDRSDSPAEVAFYGGTFTALPVELQRSCLEAVQPFIRSGRIGSIRLSTRPDCVAPPILELLRKDSVRTIELGAQSLDDRVLALSGRGHTGQQTADSVRLLREFKFSVGLQLMPGLPGDSAEIFRETVSRTLALRPDFVRLYPALVIKDTALEDRYHDGSYKPLTLADAVQLCKIALLQFRKAGIDVIRIGLQPTEELEKEGTIVAGPYHPAFRQLVESSIMLDRMRSAVQEVKQGKQVTFLVNPTEISNAAGQNRSNIELLKKEFALTKITLQPDKNISPETVRLVS